VEHDGPAVLVEGLTKAFGGVRALQGVDLAIARGTVLGLLGPNGSGKTTTVRILTTLLPADGGRAAIEGIDVFRHPEAVRAIIGLAGQQASVDETLTGRENLELAARLFHLPRKEARRRADELLERLGLADAGNRPAKTYSGGMRRRLDLGASLVGRPKVLFLDEPTTGLDPRSRLDLWDLIRDLVQDGTTLLLTTQYLEEADQLADEIAVIDHGKVIASGTPDQLKDRIGGDVLELRVVQSAQLDAAVQAVETLGSAPLETDRTTGTVIVPVGSQGSNALVEAVRRLDTAGVKIADLALRRPSLDTVFLALTGHAAEDEAAPEASGRRARRGRVGASSR